MFTVNFYASYFDIRVNSIGKKDVRLVREKAAYWLLFTLVNSLVL